MKITLNTTTDKLATIPGSGNYLLIESATGPLLVTVRLKNGRQRQYPMQDRTQIRFDDDIEELELQNRHNADNVVELETGIGEFLPNNDGQRVTLTGQDLTIEVQNPPGQPLDVQSADLGATNDAAAGTDSGNFSLIALIKRLLGKVPNNGQKVMTGSLPVVIASDQSAVAVTGPLTDAQLRAAAVPVSGPATAAEIDALTLDVQQVAFATVTPGNAITGSGVIPANAGRLDLIVWTDDANAGNYWTGGAADSGLKLRADKMVTLRTTGALTLTADNPADKIYFLEIEA